MDWVAESGMALKYVENRRPFQRGERVASKLSTNVRRRGISGVRPLTAGRHLADQEPFFSATEAGSSSRSLPTRSFNDALQNRPASIWF
jgi:hypothetical protein